MFNTQNPYVDFPNDVYKIFGIAAFFGVAKFLIEEVLLKRLSNYLFVSALKDKLQSDLKEDKIALGKAQEKAKKFSATGFKFFVQSCLALAGIYSAVNCDWISTPKVWFNGGLPVPMSSISKAHYLIDAGIYLFQFIAVFFEPKQKDFHMMIIHHLVTLFLIFVSFFYNMTRVGELIMLLHDICDPFMEAAKLMNYLDFNKIRDALFASFAIVFAVSRCIIFPLLAIRGTITEGVYPDGTWLPFIRECVICLCTLLVLNYVWTYLIYKAATRTKLDDIRDE